MKIAVEGCCHGELDKIYETLQHLEETEGIKVDLLLCCGDFQAVRNETDLTCMEVLPKYRHMRTFYKYYSREKKAPVLTVFIGGNHEASNHLWELPYGGWVAPDIYYLGYAGVVNFGGVRIAGLSGIFESHEYRKGSDEKAPDRKGSDEKAPDRKGSDEKAPDRKGRDEKAPDRKGRDEKPPDRKGSYEKAPDRKGPYEKAPDRKGPYEKAPDRKGRYEKPPDEYHKGRYEKAPDRKGPYEKAPDRKGRYEKPPDEYFKGPYKKPPDEYFKGHYEKPPYDKATLQSAYLIRSMDVFNLKLLSQPLDIFLSHDWPRGVYHYGNLEDLYRYKEFLRNQIEANTLGSPPAGELLETLQPAYWFAAHLHIKFPALVPHQHEGGTRFTKFLALDKCLPRRNFLQVVDVGAVEGPMELSYDAEWLAVVKRTHELTNVTSNNTVLPTSVEEIKQYRPDEVAVREIVNLFGGNLTVPKNFVQTVTPYDPSQPTDEVHPPKPLSNPQTRRFCARLGIKNHYMPAEPQDPGLPIPSSNPDEMRVA